MRRLALTLVLAATVAGTALAEVWDREAALSRAADYLTVPATDALLDLTPLLGAADLQARLDAVRDDPALALPARERILRDYAYRLRDRAPDAVAWQVLEELGHYRSAVRVPHPEFPTAASVPLFDVASAARGTLNQWTRVGARATAERALAGGDLDRLAALCASPHRQQVLGAREAVERVPMPALRALSVPLAAALGRRPELAPVVQAAAARLGDATLLATVVQHAPGPWAARSVRDAERWLAPAEAVGFLLEVARWAPPSLAAIAFDGLAGHAATRPDVRDFLVGRLGHPELGAAAAVALARSADDGVLDVLAKTIRTGPPQARRHARLALETSIHPRAPAVLGRAGDREAGQ